MSFFKSGNPTLKASAFEGTVLAGIETGEEMTLKGTLNKFGFLLLLMMGTTIFSWNHFYNGNNPMPLLLTGVFGGLGVALVISFKRSWSPYLAPAYALLKGLAVGSISAYYDFAYETSYPGLVMQAVGLTLVVALVMFLLYHNRIIRVTARFKSIIIIATVSLMVFYLIQFIGSLAGYEIAAFTNASTPIGIGFSVLVVCLAALFLLLDFDMIEKGIEGRAAKYMEWYGAFALVVTLVWLYLEILRLLSKLRK